MTYLNFAKAAICVMLSLFALAAFTPEVKAQACTTAPLDLMCPNGQYLQGIQNNGTKLCKNLAAGAGTAASCPPGQVLQGFDASGTATCVSGPGGASCNPMAVYGAGATSVTNLAHGDVTMIIGTCSDGWVICYDGTLKQTGSEAKDCGGMCFTAGTKVLMASGTSKAIEEIQVGDTLVGQNGSHNTVLELKQPVKAVGHPLYAINGSGYFVTEDHPFMTTEGWKAINPSLTNMSDPTLDVAPLEVGDVLIRRDERVEITSIDSKKVTEETRTYNFRLSGDGTYYADGYLVNDYAPNAPEETQ